MFSTRGGQPRKCKFGSLTVALLVAVTLTGCGTSRAGARGDSYVPRTRTYYLAADVVRWDYASAGRNEITGVAFDRTAKVFVQRGPHRIGSTYLKALFREYTDATFRHLKPRPARWQHLGMLGPVIRAVVGDHVRVVFRNNTDRPTSVHMHGLKYDKLSEGAPYADGTRGTATADDAVAPGRGYTYHYTVPERAGPGPGDPSSIPWMYHSHVDEVGDDYAGLVGPVIVTRQSMARPDGTPRDVDREFVLQFKVSNENKSAYLRRNITTFVGRPKEVDVADEAFEESNLMHSINGYVFGSQPLASMTMRVGENVRWYVMGMGSEVDLHTAHWHGNNVVSNHMRTDVVPLLPASMAVADMAVDNPGTWLLHCHVNDHISAGMLTRYRVLP